MPKIGGIIASLGLQDWWLSLDDQDRSDLLRYQGSQLGSSGSESLIVGGTSHKGLTVMAFCSSFMSWALAEKKYALAEKLLKCGESSEGPVLDAHYLLNAAIELYYKQRDTQQDALKQAICYCMADIKLFPEYEKPLRKLCNGKLARCPSFQQLCVIFEKLGMYVDALNVANMALNYRLDDGTVGGFAGRVAKLAKKLTTTQEG